VVATATNSLYTNNFPANRGNGNDIVRVKGLFDVTRGEARRDTTFNLA